MALTNLEENRTIAQELNEALQTVGNVLDILYDTRDGAGDMKKAADVKPEIYGIEQSARELRIRASELYNVVGQIRDRLGSSL